VAQIGIVGLGQAGLLRLSAEVRDLLLDPETHVIVRTVAHPAAAELAERREVESCDDLYETATDFEEVYDSIARRVIDAATRRPVVYAVPGSPLIGEFAVGLIRQRAPVMIISGESFLDASLAAIGYDPLDRGLRVLDGHRLPEPLLIDGPTVVAHLDTPVVFAEVAAALARVVDPASTAKIVIDAGGAEETVVETDLHTLDPKLAGLRTTLYLDPAPGGLAGVVQTMARLRRECPWDRRQTHQTLVKNLIEETFELVEAISSGNEGAIEDELGDVLLQVLFHSEISAEAGGFGIEDVAENLRQKLVRRHPHVFADVVAESAAEVKANWDEIKANERPVDDATSILDGVPTGMPALERAAKIQRKAATVGFDWPEAIPVLGKVAEELAEVRAALEDPQAAAAELGDLLFAVVNLARHLEVDPELALTGSIGRFVDRFGRMEAEGPFEGLSLADLDARWERAKRQAGPRPVS